VEVGGGAEVMPVEVEEEWAEDPPRGQGASVFVPTADTGNPMN